MDDEETTDSVLFLIDGDGDGDGDWEVRLKSVLP